MDALQAEPRWPAASTAAANAILAHDTLDRHIQSVLGKTDGDFRTNARDQQRNLAATQRLDALDTSFAQFIEKALKRVREASEEVGKAGLEAGNRKAASIAALGALGNEEGIFPAWRKQTSRLPRRWKPARGGNRAASARRKWAVSQAASTRDGNQDRCPRTGETVQKGAFSLLADLDKFLKQYSTYNKPVMTTGAIGADGTLMNKTPQQAMRAAQDSLAARQEADASALGANLAFARASEGIPQAAAKMTKAMESWRGMDDAAGKLDTGKAEEAISALGTLVDGAVSEIARIKALAAGEQKVLERNAQDATRESTTANQSKGGFAGYFSSGGDTRGTDTMLARVDPHEFIMNAQASASFKSQLTAMNQGHDPNSAGRGNHTNVGDIHVHVQGGSTSQATIQEIAAGLNRGIRQGTIRLGR